MKRIKLAAALITAGILLCGCSAEVPEASGNEIIQEDVRELCLFENGEGVYQLVRAEECSEEVLECVKLGRR